MGNPAAISIGRVGDHMASRNTWRGFLLALALGVASCGGSSISSPGASDPGTGPGGGGGGGGGVGGGVCPSGFNTLTAVNGVTVCEIAGVITSNRTIPFVSGVAYRLSGRVDVGVDVGGDGTAPTGDPVVLTVEPGVTIFGASGADYLVVNRGSQIVAEGTETNPITFTSQSQIAGTIDEDNAIGQWGGLVILGRAPIGNCNTAVAAGTVGCQQEVEGISGTPALYGGARPNDRSGELRYVRVLFAGFPLPGTAGNELNGITFAGVGNETEVEYIQVHNNADDGVEFFGGTVNAKYVVLTGNDDDSLDYDAGWVGNMQFVLVRQRPSAGDRIVEASNATGSSTAPQLRSRPTISNFTFIGTRTTNIIQNSGASGILANGVLTGSAQCLNNAAAATSPAPTFNSVLFGCADPADAVGDTNIAAGTNNLITTSTLAGVFPGPTEVGATAINPTTLGSFFSAGTYIGAFSPTETEADNWAAGWTYRLFEAPPCPTGTTEGTFGGERQCTLSGRYNADLRLPRGNIYRIAGRIDIGTDIGGDGAAVGGDPATLTIDAGVTLYGASGADYIVVNRGSQILANGTRSAPVTMTSLNDLTNSQADATNAIGEWGGLVILGRAPIGNCNTAIAAGILGCQQEIEGVSGTPALYGGATANDSSGRLTYLRVKFAGFPLPGTAGNELNGITFGGVGSGTEVDYIQVHNNADDGVEFFGGTVNVRHLVLTGNDDDSIDWDAGFIGNIQFAIVVQRTAGGDRVVEASNATGSSIAPQLRSRPTLSNFTFVGTRARNITMNSGTSGVLANGVVVGMGASTICLDAEAAAAAPNSPTFNSVLFDCPTATSGANSDGFIAAGANNSTAVADSLTNTFINGATENGRTAVNPTTLGGFFTAATYLGAVQNSSDRWWADWSCGLEAGTPC